MRLTRWALPGTRSLASARATLIGLAVASLLVAACGPSEEEVAAQARADKWQQLQDMEGALEAKRQELAAVREQISAAAEAADEAVDATALEEQATGLAAEIQDASDALMPELVNFINDSNAAVGEVPQELQAALRMKSDLDIDFAEQYVSEGGDYRRAVEILENAQQYDPDYGKLDELIAYYQDWRYVREPRFAEIKNGMTQPEVEEILGKVHHRNQREYEDQGVVAWFYPKDPAEAGEGAPASAIYFNQKRGVWKVYKKDWEVKTQ